MKREVPWERGPESGRETQGAGEELRTDATQHLSFLSFLLEEPCAAQVCRIMIGPSPS